MGEGRLIRVSKYRGDPEGVAYLVASDKARALELVRAKFGRENAELEDLGRVSEALIKAMSLPPDGVIAIDGVRHVSQQQQPQPDDPDKKE
jgi:hypothetical protein